MRSFIGKIILEGIAVFFAISAALFVDAVKDRNRIALEEKAHLGNLYAQVAGDIVYLNYVEQCMDLQHAKLDSFLLGLPNAKFDLESSFIYEPPTELFCAMINSNAFNDLYDSTIYYAINDQMRDFKLIATIQEKTDKLQELCMNEYVMPYEKGRGIDFFKLGKPSEWYNLMKNRLLRLNDFV